MTRTIAGAEQRTRTITSFADPTVSAADWDRLAGETTAAAAVFLRHAWQRLWWQASAEGPLAIAVAERAGRPHALAPLYAAGGTLMLVGSGSADYLDFPGLPDERTLAVLLAGARDAVPEFSEVKLYHLPADSPTSALLPAVAARLDLELYTEEEVGAPYADLTDPALLAALTSRLKVRKEEARMRRAGELRVRRAAAEEADELVEVFIDQHGARWRALGQESFERPGSRELVRTVVADGLRDGWAVLTVLEWRGVPAALDVSLVHGGTQLNWLVSRDPAIEEFSCGSVLAAHVARYAAEHGIRRLDFGLGEEEYKLRHASGVTKIANWFMYP